MSKNKQRKDPIINEPENGELRWAWIDNGPVYVGANLLSDCKRQVLQQYKNGKWKDIPIVELDRKYYGEKL